MKINLNSTMNRVQLKKTHWNSSERPKTDKNNSNRISTIFHNFHDEKWPNSNSPPWILSPPSTTSYLRTSIQLQSRQIQNKHSSQHTMNGRIAKPRLKSKESNIRAFVKFVNTSLRDVDVYWLNFKGDRISYSSLPPGSSCNVSCTEIDCICDWDYEKWKWFFSSP